MRVHPHGGLLKLAVIMIMVACHVVFVHGQPVTSKVLGFRTTRGPQYSTAPQTHPKPLKSWFKKAADRTGITAVKQFFQGSTKMPPEAHAGSTTRKAERLSRIEDRMIIE
ncbi:hypothetical protein CAUPRSCDRAFT_12145 [Caulochytrium protostelioides]|uniref:Secreted protein n=1 Tax=Caulochytrium protostelioides TaxID=1555241 RepID=A0A4P9WSG4_9FUNG|nr:hypothetical protein CAUPRSCDRAFT_12145 [Caulochytrium protostelioides]